MTKRKKLKVNLNEYNDYLNELKVEVFSQKALFLSSIHKLKCQNLSKFEHHLKTMI